MLAGCDCGLEGSSNGLPVRIGAVSEFVSDAHVEARRFLLEVDVKSSPGCDANHQTVFMRSWHILFLLVPLDEAIHFFA